ncbi:hypothetical protein DPMN_102972 [Dreissena polymorpha]|uniref:Uncharacterized protein n=1 Tax=Dreissena polymorpha TaxID=45954 RepID=A0A9D4K0D0_DREPO|nr:hypothetical protein DPMN_102972 [Dreissena polymorpha]
MHGTLATGVCASVNWAACGEHVIKEKTQDRRSSDANSTSCGRIASLTNMFHTLQNTDQYKDNSMLSYSQNQLASSSADKKTC